MVDLQLYNNIKITSKVQSYEVSFINNISEQIKLIVKEGDCIIIDANIANLYKSLTSCFQNNFIYQLEANEEAKSYTNIEKIIIDIVESGFRKNNKIISIGGGITQDVSSFISFILYRGVKWVFYPTNLLSQCDSCIGSKLSINLKQYKNLLGGFYPPSQIFIDTSFLVTLSKKEIHSGFGEMLHYFLVNSNDDYLFFQSVLKNNDLLLNIDSFIKRSLLIKKNMIEIDEFDNGPRHIFNYGHSFGHALESVTNYSIPHGIAVAYGIDLANLVSVKMGLLSKLERNRIRELCSFVISDYPLPYISIEKFEMAIKKDKKNIDNQLGLILSRGIGKMEKVFCSFEDIKSTIEYFFNQKQYSKDLT
jgi:3-dehydroquinate synthase